MARWLVLGTLLLGLWGAVAPEAAQAWDASETARMRAGALIIHELPTRAGATLEAGCFVAAPITAARAVLWDHASFPAFVPDCKAVRILHHAPSRDLVEMIGGRGPLTVSYTSQRVLTADRIAWRTVKGDLKRNDGFWAFSAVPGGTLLRYHVHVETYQPVPGSVVAYLQKRSLPGMITAIKQRILARAGQDAKRASL